MLGVVDVIKGFMASSKIVNVTIIGTYVCDKFLFIKILQVKVLFFFFKILKILIN